MRTMLSLTALLLIAGCSCQRNAEQSQEATTAAATAPEQEQVPLAQPGQPIETLPAEKAGYAEAASTLHAYLRVIAAKQWNEADSYWTGGKAPSQPGDMSIRAAQDLRSMRIQNGSPKPLDNESPARSIEIPVTLRVRETTGITEINGWYRLRRKVGGDGWEITSASLQPALD
jgi:hypothetical protein